MTKSEAIRHRALRCRPGNSDRYIAKHDALLAEPEPASCSDCRHFERGCFQAPAMCGNIKTAYWDPIYGRRYRVIGSAYEVCKHRFYEPRLTWWQIIRGWFA